MHKFLTLTSTTALLLSAFLITGCGGSDSSSDDGGGGTTTTTFTGNTTPAAIDAANSADIGKAAGESIQTADASTGLPTGITTSNNSAPIDLTEINEIITSMTNTLNLPAGLDLFTGLCSSGTVSTSDPSSSTSESIDSTFTFNNCVLNDTNKTLNGTLLFHTDDSNNVSITYNFTVTDSSGTHTVNMTMTCANISCTFNSDFKGSDGVTHRVTNFNISGDASSGFSGDATFFHGTYGEVTISISGITYGGSCGSIPNGGSISYTSSDGSSGTILFAGDCSVSGTWNDNIGGAGSF